MPVPVVYYVDENPYARVGGELVVMSEVSFFQVSFIFSLVCSLDRLLFAIVPRNIPTTFLPSLSPPLPPRVIFDGAVPLYFMMFLPSI